MKSPEKVGEFSAAVVELLALDVPAGTEIYVGETNRQHMATQHPQDYQKYYARIDKIVNYPDFVGINSADGSIELIKTFSKYVKVAVRVANDEKFYARSLYEVGKSRVDNAVKRGELKKVLTSD
jgi:hypothetical protein